MADPTDPATFESAVLDPSVVADEPHRSVLAAYTELLAVRRRHAVVHDPAAEHRVERDGDVVVVERRLGDRRSVLLLHLGTTRGTIDLPAGPLEVAFDAGDERWGGPGPQVVHRDGRWRLDGPTAVLLVGTATA